MNNLQFIKSYNILAQIKIINYSQLGDQVYILNISDTTENPGFKLKGCKSANCT